MARVFCVSYHVDIEVSYGHILLSLQRVVHITPMHGQMVKEIVKHKCASA